MENDVHPNISQIRELLRHAFTEQQLRRFCQDRPDFQQVLLWFSEASSMEGMVDCVLRYCKTFLLWREFLVEIEKYNPRQYDRHGPYFLPTIDDLIDGLDRGPIPVRIQQRISYSQLIKACEKTWAILKDRRFPPDRIIGIHYMGTIYAATLAVCRPRPTKLHIVSTIYRDEDRPILDTLSWGFDLAEISTGEKLLIVDNSIHSGRTLRIIREEVSKYTKQVKTLVFYRDPEESRDPTEPDPKDFLDLLLFEWPNKPKGDILV